MQFTTPIFLGFATLAVANPLENRAPARCNADNCLRELERFSTAATLDCSSLMTQTNTVTITPTASIVLSKYTKVSSIVVTTTEFKILVTTVTTTVSAKLLPARELENKRSSIPSLPTYASACSSLSRFSSACSCIGITGAIVIQTHSLPVSTKTIISSVTVTATIQKTTTISKISTRTVVSSISSSSTTKKTTSSTKTSLSSISSLLTTKKTTSSTKTSLSSISSSSTTKKSTSSTKTSLSSVTMAPYTTPPTPKTTTKSSSFSSTSTSTTATSSPTTAPDPLPSGFFYIQVIDLSTNTSLGYLTSSGTDSGINVPHIGPSPDVNCWHDSGSNRILCPCPPSTGDRFSCYDQYTFGVNLGCENTMALLDPDFLWDDHSPSCSIDLTGRIHCDTPPGVGVDPDAPFYSCLLDENPLPYYLSMGDTCNTGCSPVYLYADGLYNFGLYD